jgi:hypothetical protein
MRMAAYATLGYATLRTLGAACALTATLGAAAAQQEWKTYSFPDDGFAIDLPGAPDVSTEPRALPIVSHRQYQADAGIAVYIVSAKRYMPDARLDLWNDESMVELAEAMKGGCRLRDGKPMSVAKALSYEMVLDQCPGGSTMKVRLHVVGNLLFQLVAAGIAGIETRPDTLRFHDSFKLIPMKPPPPDAEQAALEKEDAEDSPRHSRGERRHHRRGGAAHVKKRRGHRG